MVAPPKIIVGKQMIVKIIKPNYADCLQQANANLDAIVLIRKVSVNQGDAKPRI